MNRRTLSFLLASLLVSIFGAGAGRWLLASLNDPVPGVLAALHAHADPEALPPGELLERGPARRVVVVLIDGLGEGPFQRCVAQAALADVRWEASLDSGVPSLSRPVYHAILSGVPQWASGIRENSYTSGRADSVPDRVRAHGGKVAWMLETVPWFHDLFGAPGDIVVEGRAASSVEAFERVLDAGPDLTVIHLTGVDQAGHSFGADSAEYEGAARDAMATVSALRAASLKRPGGEEAIWFVGADHGHMPRGGHGGEELAVRRVSWIALYGGGAAGEGADGASALRAARSTPDGASALRAARSVELAPPGAAVTALAPTFARALGVEAPRESMADGLPLREALLGAPLRADPARVSAVEAARAARGAPAAQTQDGASAPRAARSTAEERARAGETRRGAIAVGVVIAALGALVWRRGARGVAEALVVASAVLGFLVAGPALSLSAVRTRAWYLVDAGGLMTVSAALAWAMARRWASPLASAAASAALPLAALVATGGSLGLCDATPLETVLWPSLGLIPAGVCAGIALVEGGARFARSLTHRSRAG